MTPLDEDLGQWLADVLRETTPRQSYRGLTVEEMREAYGVGLARHMAARARGAKQLHGFDQDSAATQKHLDGCSAVAELLVARRLNREWLSSGMVPDRPEDGDVSGGVMVRWTPREDGSLILHPSDHDALYAVLVVGDPPEQRIMGWIPTAYGKQEWWWREDVRAPAFFVPQSKLYPINELLGLLK